MNPSDDDLTFAGEDMDPFAPSRVDSTIAAALLDRESASGSHDDRLVLALAAGHALPANASATIERVRARLAAAPIAASTTLTDAEAPKPSRPAHSTVPRPDSRVQTTMRALAAVLLVALLAGGFTLALHGRQGTVTHASRWVDVSITHAHTTQPLDFDLANGISYAVAQTGGTIYACSGTSLWYSSDGGITYAPFTPAPPADTLDGMCTLGTVPGLPGVFVNYQLPGTSRISYGEPGGTWRTLDFPGVVHAAAVDPSASLPVLAVPPGQDHQDIGSAIFSPGLVGGHVAQYAGQWLLIVIEQPGRQATQQGLPLWALIATRDFGKTWVWLDATLFNQYHQNCTNFIVAASSSSALDCMAENPDQQPFPLGLALSSNFGETWQRSESLVSPAPLVLAGTDSTGILFVRSGANASRQLAHYSPEPGNWSVLATLPDWPRNPGSLPPPLALMPNGAVYQPFAGGNAGAVTVGLDAVAPGASRVAQITAPVTLRAKGLTPTLAFGDLDGTAPALYLGVGNAMNKGDISPLYRLALPAPVKAPSPTATIAFPTAVAPSTPQPRAECAGNPQTTAAIRAGGLGALSSTLTARWGGGDGVAAGTTYIGRYSDTGQAIVSVPSIQLGGRVANLTYHVDSTAHVTLAQAQALAATILPADAHSIPNGAPPSTVSPITDTYCSAAFWAAFPPGTSSFSYGELAVTYYLRPDGSVDSIDFSPALIG